MARSGSWKRNVQQRGASQESGEDGIASVVNLVEYFFIVSIRMALTIKKKKKNPGYRG